MSKFDTISAKERGVSEYMIMQAMFNYLIEALQTEVERPFEELVTKFIDENMAELSNIPGDPNVLSEEYFKLFADWFNDLKVEDCYNSKGIEGLTVQKIE